MEWILPLAILALIAAIAGSFYLKRKRRQEMAAFASKHGFTYSPQPPPGLLAYSFPLFSKGDGRGALNGVWGDFRAMPFMASDYWYYTESSDSKGRRSRDYDHFSVVVIEVDAWLPVTTAHRENIFTAIADRIGFKDIQFESDEFNRAWQVKGEDRKFAFELIDARMMQWMLSIDRRVNLEFNGKAALVYSKRLKPAELLMLIGTARELPERIPRLVYKEYALDA